jgi:endonuclease I
MKRIKGIALCTYGKRLAGAKAVEILLHHVVPLQSKIGKQRQKP